MILVAALAAAAGAQDSFVERAEAVGIHHKSLAGMDRVGQMAAGIVDWVQTGVGIGDLDGDGDPDVVLAGGLLPNHVFRNDGGRFTDVTSLTGMQGNSMNDGSEAHRVNSEGRGDTRSASTPGENAAEQRAGRSQGADDASRSGESRGGDAAADKTAASDQARFQQALRSAQKEGLRNGIDNLMEGIDERAMDRLRKAGANRRKASTDNSNVERMSALARRVKKANLGGDAQKTAAVAAVTGIARALSENGQGAERPVSIDTIGSIAMGGELGARGVDAADAGSVDTTAAAL